MPEPPTVFISYSHKDEGYRDEMRGYLEALELRGQIALWDDRSLGGGQDWYRQIADRLDNAKVALLLITRHFLGSSFCSFEETPVLLQRRRQGKVVVIPVLFERCLWDVERWLKQAQMRPGRTPLMELDKAARQAALNDIAREVRDYVGGVKKPPEPVVTRWSDEAFDLSHLPETGSLLFGRNRELDLLDDAWQDRDTHLVAFTAGGGVGKSTLCRVWCEQLAEDDFRGAERAFGWSFYSQGTGRMTAADAFIERALSFFGDADPTAGSPWERGERLAALIRRQRTLLVLDGVEPLQSAHEVDRGQITDPALQTLLLELARDNPGLCLVSTRERLSDLAGEPEPRVRHCDLDQVSTLAGRALLRVSGVKGDDEKLEAVVEGLGNHALAVNLLASLLEDTPTRHVDGARELLGDGGAGGARDPRASAFRAIEAWAARLTQRGEHAALQLLRLMGLFDRPTDRATIEALRAAPAVRNLTEHLQDADLEPALERLRAARLLGRQRTHQPDELDCHPLLRELFAAALERQAPEAYRTGHERLYRHYAASADKRPDTLQGLLPLYTAVSHGCAAGLHQEVLEEVYRRRILRGKEFFATKKLGAWALDLAALRDFFAEPWGTPLPNLTSADRSWVSAEVGFRLRALGRLREAAEPMKAALDVHVAEQDWMNAAQGAGNLSQLQLSLGEFARALSLAERSVGYADDSGDGFRRTAMRTARADALHQAGRLQEAHALFAEAESMQRKRQPWLPRLFSVQGYRYSDLLLGLGRAYEVVNRATYALEVSARNRWLLATALDHLTLGRAVLACGRLPKAASELQAALNGLRGAGTQEFIPLGLLACAELALAQDDPERAAAHLRESLRLTTRLGTRLLEADTHLGFTRLHLKQDALGDARASLEKARALIEATGYHRRDVELARLDAELARRSQEPAQG